MKFSFLIPTLEIWIRGQRVEARSERSSNISDTNSEVAIAPNVQRQKRQARLFRVIILLMLVFFICRLPTWIFTIYKLNYTDDDSLYWMEVSFNILVLINCALNPYLYTFMSETIQLMAFLGAILTCRKDNGIILSS